MSLAGVEACPHAPSPGPALPASGCRKPAPGLLQRAADRLHIDLARSWMIGDILDDVEAGRRAGRRSVLMDVGNETVWRRAPERVPHHRVRDLGEAARIILAQPAALAEAAPFALTSVDLR